MLTYRVRRRVFKLEEGAKLPFPGEGLVRFHLSPAQPFGLSPGGGRTIVRAVAASILFNANTGEHTAESKAPLKPLDVRIEAPNRAVALAGNKFELRERFEDFAALHATIESIYFGLPALLNLKFADPPIVERVDGIIGGVAFRWELADWRVLIRPTTQDEQEAGAAQAWEWMGTLSVPRHRRLIAATQYFHTACRLSRRGSTPGEFMAEVVLNLSKVLEVLFPSDGDGKTREAVREGLKSLGFPDHEREALFLPAIALRNELDVGHVELGLLTRDELTVVHEYTEAAEDAFRSMLNRVLTRAANGEFKVAPYEPGPASPRIKRVVRRVREQTARLHEARQPPGPPGDARRA